MTCGFNTGRRNRLKFPYEKLYEGEFITNKPTDIVWLDKEEWSQRRRFTSGIVTCVYCKKEIKVMFLYTMFDRLEERLRGKLCPNCNMVSLRL